MNWQSESDVESDLRNNIIVKWHEERHLNKWASEDQYGFLDPLFCDLEEQIQPPKGEVSTVAINKTKIGY